MKWLMLCREPRLYSCQRLKQAAEERGFQLDILDPQRFLLKLDRLPSGFSAFYQPIEQTELQAVEKYVAVLPRFGTTSTEMGCHILRHFEGQHVPCLNGSLAIASARHKWQSLQTLAAHQIAVPPSLLAGELSENRAYFSPLVMKTLSGSQGEGVMLAENAHTARSMLSLLKQADLAVLQQAFIAEAAARDIRAFVIGDQVVAAMQRQGTSGDFRANIHQGGRAEKLTLNDEEQKLAVKAAQAFGLEVAGVDLIRSEQGLLVLEVNASPGLEMIETVSGIDIAGLMIEALEKKLTA